MLLADKTHMLLIHRINTVSTPILLFPVVPFYLHIDTKM